MERLRESHTGQTDLGAPMTEEQAARAARSHGDGLFGCLGVVCLTGAGKGAAVFRTVAAARRAPTPWQSEPRPAWLPPGWQTTPTPPSSPSGSPSPTAGHGPGTKQLRGLRVNRRRVGGGTRKGQADSKRLLLPLVRPR